MYWLQLKNYRIDIVIMGFFYHDFVVGMCKKYPWNDSLLDTYLELSK